MARQICVVGAGRWGRNHIRTLHELGLLGGVVDSDEEALGRLREEYPSAEFFTSLHAALERSFDGFVVATPAETHRTVGEVLIDHGRPVLFEKPLALRSSDARWLKQRAEERGVNLMVGHVLLFHPAVRKIKNLLREGKLGQLQYLYSNRLNLGTVRSEENILWSFAPHDISIFQFLTESTPQEVVSRGGAFLRPGTQDTTMTVLTYPGNIVGHIFVSWLHPFKEHRLVLIGSKGMLSFEDSSKDKHLLFYEKGIDWIEGEPVSRDGPTEQIPYHKALPLTEELRYFAARLDGSPIEIAGADSAIEVLEILERATASLSGAAGTAAPAPAAAPDYYVHPSSYIDEGVRIGPGTKIWHFSHVQSGASIGRDCSLGQNVNVGKNVRIGNGVKIQDNVSIYEGVEIEDYVFCGPSMVFTNVLDPRAMFPRKDASEYDRTRVCEGATIGANSTILCGNTLGRHAFVAAGAVVSRDVPDFALVRGVPAAQVGWVCECGQRLPEGGDHWICPRCGGRYRRVGARLVPAPVEA